MAAKYLLYQQTLLAGLPLVGGPTVQSVLDARAAEGYRVHTLGPWTATLIQILFAKDEPLLAPAPVVNVAAPNVSVSPNVAAPVVRVDAPIINVDAPQVSVEAPVVHIAAPQIDVHLPEATPAAVTVQGVTQPGRAMRSAPVLKQGPRPR